MSPDATRALLARSTSLDAFTRCRTPGCEVMVHLSSGIPNCHRHGGDPSAPEYLTSADDGAFIWARHVVINLGGECE